MRRRTRLALLFNAAAWLSFALVALGAAGLTQGELVVTRALEHLDAPYRYAAAGPDAFDCSGFARWCLMSEGISLPHSAKDIGSDDRYPLITNPRRLMVGDMVCFDTVGDSDPYDHVGFYMGGGRFVHASSAKGKVVVSDLDGYYLDQFTGARRIAQVWF